MVQLVHIHNFETTTFHSFMMALHISFLSVCPAIMIRLCRINTRHSSTSLKCHLPESSPYPQQVATQTNILLTSIGPSSKKFFSSVVIRDRIISSSLRTADVFPVAASLPPKNMTRNTSAVCRLNFVQIS